MAKPSVSTYNTNGWVVTDRTREIGEWGKTTLAMKVIGTAGPMHPPAYSLCAGNAQFVFSASHTIAIYPVVTWVDYPSDTIFEIDSTSGTITSTDATVQTSFEDEWTDQDHEIEFRWLCVLWSQTRTGGDYTACYILSAGNGSFWATSAMPQAYFPNITGELSWTLEIKTKYTAHEQVEISQNLDSGGDWVFNSDWLKTWLGKTTAEFRDISTEAEGGFVSDGITVNGVSHRRPSVSDVVFGNERTLQMQCGVAQSTIPFFGSATAYSIGFVTLNEAVYSSVSKIAECQIGTTDANLRFGYDDTTNEPIEYYGAVTTGDYPCASYAEDDTISYYCTRTAYNNAATGHVEAIWTDLGLSFKYAGDTRYMDGSDVDITPEYSDVNGKEWTGDTSDLYVYSGVWSLEMTNVYNGAMSTWTPTDTDHVSGQAAKWARDEPSPTAFGELSLDNASDYNVCDLQWYDENTSQHVTSYDKRTLLSYPRRHSVFTWTDTEAVIDDMDVASASGWQGHNCTVSIVSGKLTVTNVASGAYIYNANFLTDADNYKPKHWPGYRFAKIKATVTNESTSIAEDYVGTLSVKRTVGYDTMIKEFTHFRKSVADGVTLAYYDTCKPDGSAGVDITDSYINVALPYDSIVSDGDRVYQERSALSWSWGIGAFDTIQIEDLGVGLKYEFEELTGTWINPGTAESSPHKYGNIIYVNRSFEKMIHAGDMQISEGETETAKPLYVSRVGLGILNGRIAFEALATQMTQSALYVIDILQNYSLKEVFEDKTYFLPQDDFDVFAFTNVIGAWDNAWWDSTNLEYTTEHALFCPEVCPAGFLDDTKDSNDASNPHDNETTDKGLYARPRFDLIKVNAWWGDGTQNATRQTYITIPFTKRLRGRAHGIIWDNAGLTPKEAQPLESNPNFSIIVDNISVETDAEGYYRSAAFDQNTRVHTTTIAEIANRFWTRVCGTLAGAGTWLCACHSKNTGRIYVAYNKTGSGFYLKIYDHLNPIPIEREISATQVDSAGIAVTDDRKAEIKVVYESGGTVYYITSNDEGKTWSEAVSIVSGATYPQVNYSPDDGVEIVSYYLTNKARCKRKLGTGSYGAEIEIADAIESVVPIVPARGERQAAWIAFVTQTGNEVKRYKSTDSGRTWTLDE